jgi:hypothetical protein
MLPFLGKVLVLPANVRQDWKKIARYKCTSLFGLDLGEEGKKFYKTDTRSTAFPQRGTKKRMRFGSDLPEALATAHKLAASFGFTLSWCRSFRFFYVVDSVDK